MTSQATIVFCPRCGSTEAGEGDSSSIPPALYLMRCTHCGHSSICDDWEIKSEWNTTADVSGGLPPFVAPIERLVSVLRSRGAPNEAVTYAFARIAAHAWRTELSELSAELLRLPEGDVEAELLLWLRPLGSEAAEVGKLPGFDAETAARVVAALGRA